MFRSNRAYFIAGCFLLILAGFSAPRLLTTDDDVPVGEFNGAVVPFTLQAGQEVTQTFLTGARTISGVTLTTPAYDNAPRTLFIRLQDERGLVTTATLFSVTTKDDHSVLRLAVPRLHITHKQKLTLTVGLRSGNPITLLKGTENPYPYGQLNSGPTDDLIFSIIQPAPMSQTSAIGMIAGLVVFAATLFLQASVPRHWHGIGALALLLLVVAIAVPSWWLSRGRWGIGDWDYRLSIDTIYRNTIVQFHQFPLWNPYTCGGTAALADPEFSVLTPTFLLELVFGVAAGARLALYASIAITSTGAFALARKLGLSATGAFTTALIATYTSGFLLKAAEGHETIIFAYMWLPWALWAWRRTYQHEIRTLWCGLFLAMIFLQGGLYMLSYICFGFFLLIVFSSQKKRAAHITLQAGLWATGMAALKLLPTLLWLKQFPDRDYVASTETARNLTAIYLQRFTHGAWVLPNQTSGWHEYGAYIGYFALALTLIGLSSYTSKRWVRCAIWSVALAITLSSLGEFLQPLFNHVPFIPRSNISRLAFVAVLGLGLLAGNGIDTLKRYVGSKSLLIPLIIGMLAIDLLSLANPIASQTFVLSPVLPPVAPAHWPLAFTTNSYAVNHAGKEYHRDWANTVAGYGTFSFCSSIGPKPGAISPETSYVTTSPTTIPTKILKWSPTSVTVHYAARDTTSVSIATAYAEGWQANGQPAHNSAGRVSTLVPAGNGQVTFRYHAPGFMLGIVITLATMVLAFVIL